MKLQWRRPLPPPTFGALTFKLIVPTLATVVDLSPSSLSLPLLYTRRDLASSHNYWQYRRPNPSRRQASTDISDKLERAEAKLRTRRTHKKNDQGAATCSLESLKDGVDYTGSIDRMRFDMVVNGIYMAVASAVSVLLADAG